MADDIDSPWKDALDKYLAEFFELCLLEIFAQIEWIVGYESLDSELRKLVPRSRTGNQHLDRLYRVTLKNGRKAVLLIHIEIQAQKDKQFGKRMLKYRCALHLKFQLPIVSVAILADESKNWRPSEHEESVLGFGLKLTMATVKLHDYADRIEELEASDNPFASVILAHLKAQATKQDPRSRATWKVRFIRNLYERKFSKERVRELFRLIDWLMQLPDDWDKVVQEEIDTFEKEKKMPYVTGIERRAIARGEAIGEARGKAIGEARGKAIGEARGEARGELVGSLLTAMECRFGGASRQDIAIVRKLDDVETLRRLVEFAKKAETVEQVRAELKQFFKPKR